MGVLAEHVVLARGHRPLEVVGRGEDVVALALVVQVGGVALGVQGEAEDLDVDLGKLWSPVIGLSDEGVKKWEAEGTHLSTIPAHRQLTYD